MAEEPEFLKAVRLRISEKEGSPDFSSVAEADNARTMTEKKLNFGQRVSERFVKKQQSIASSL